MNVTNQKRQIILMTGKLLRGIGTPFRVILWHSVTAFALLFSLWISRWLTLSLVPIQEGIGRKWVEAVLELTPFLVVGFFTIGVLYDLIDKVVHMMGRITDRQKDETSPPS